jgi:hypothetical protein
MASTHRPGTQTDTDQVPGSDADKPTDIPAKGWLQIVKRGWKEAGADSAPGDQPDREPANA